MFLHPLERTTYISILFLESLSLISGFYCTQNFGVVCLSEQWLLIVMIKCMVEPRVELMSGECA